MNSFCCVYVLRSTIDQGHYVGLTQDLRQRLKDHNAGQVPSTQRRRPLELIYYEACRGMGDAVRREKYLKTAWGKRFLKLRLKHYLTG